MANSCTPWALRPWLGLILGLCLAAPTLAQPNDAADTRWADGSGVDIEIRHQLVYQSASGQDLALDLYLPNDRSQPVPLVIYIHGGGWVAGSREIAQLRLLPFLQMGWAAANVSYRLGKTAPAPAAVEDVRCALRWLTARTGALRIDPRRIVLAGGSAGGHLALMAAMLPSGNRFDRVCPSEGGDRWRNGNEAPLKVAAVLNWFGITDMNDLLSGPNAKHYAIEWFGAMPDREREALAREMSPLHLVRADSPPVISFHGSDDDLVPVDHSRRLHAALAAAKVPQQLTVVPGAKHGFSRAQMVVMMGQVRSFLRANGVALEP